MKVKWQIPFILVICLSACTLSFTIRAHANGTSLGEYHASGEEQMTDRVIVRFKDTPTAADTKGLAVEDKQVGSKQTISIHVPKGRDAEQVADSLEARKDIVSAEPDYMIKANYVPNDPFYAYQWHLPAIHAQQAWDRTKGAGIKVAVLDAGFDIYQEDLAGNIVASYNAVTNDRDVPVSDHGTHVAGIIAASMDNKKGLDGIAPDAKILAINVFTGDGAYTSDVIEGIYYAVAQGAKIINMSLGSYQYSDAFNQAIQYAYQHGVLIVAAAGNDTSSSSSYPASYDNVISVSSTDRYNNPSTFSNYGKNVDIAAPGTSIASTLPGNEYGYMSGTSMASPVVAGAAALVWARDPSLTNDEVANRLFSTADDLGAPGKDWFYGNGLVDAEKAIFIKEISSPVLNEISDQTTIITGRAEPGATVTIQTSGGTWKASADANGNFSIGVPKLAAGTTVQVTAADAAGNESKTVTVKVKDQTPPAAPIVNVFSDKDSTLTGKSEPGAAIQVKAGTSIYKSVSTDTGSFTMVIPRQKAGTVLEVTASDKALNTSAVTKVIVKDKTPPAPPVVNLISNRDSRLTGKSEPGSTVQAKAGTTVYQAVSTNTGSFTIAIPKQKAGTIFEISASDKALNTSAVTKVIVKDQTPPPIKINKIYNTASFITGSTEGYASAAVKIGTKTYTAKANAAGSFTISIPRQKAGTIIYYYAKDAAGNQSSVYKTPAAKAIPAQPRLNQVWSTSSTVSGQAAAHSAIEIKINGKTYKTTADKNGKFKRSISPQKAGTKLYAAAMDSAGTRSASAVIIVKQSSR
ncbi:Ig-like domain-containing protein [Peribacillus kribbensis]|uniref:Ig-like domain-containing protein n=1 Tax=Peribacillus kribbensis TaxID=356658 RepID=UPI0003F52F87|nr:Ig-like domain-containing protein [Peribacillus kribbensis]